MGSKPIGSFYVQLGLNTENFRKNLELAQRDLRAAFGTAAIHASEVLAASIGAVGAAMAAIGVKAVKMAADLERQQVALTRLLGSAEAATKKIQELQKFSAVSGLGFDELVEYQKKMMAVGFTVEETSFLMEKMADASGALGLTGLGMDRLIKAFGDVKAKGTLQTQEIKQFAEAGLPVWDMLGKAMGRTREELVKMVEARQISSATFFNAMAQQMDDRFGGMMEKMADTLTGSWNKVTNAVTISMQKLGKWLGGELYLKEFFNAVANFITNVTNFLENTTLWNILIDLMDRFPIWSDAIYTAGVALLSTLLPALSSVGNFLALMIAPLAGIYVKTLAIGLVVKDFVRGYQDGQSVILESWDVVLTYLDIVWRKFKNLGYDFEDWVSDLKQSLLDNVTDAINQAIFLVEKGWNLLIEKLQSKLPKSEILSNGLFELSGYAKDLGMDSLGGWLQDKAYASKGGNFLESLKVTPSAGLSRIDVSSSDKALTEAFRSQNNARIGQIEEELAEAQQELNDTWEDIFNEVDREAANFDELTRKLDEFTKISEKYEKAGKVTFTGGATGLESGDITEEGLKRKTGSTGTEKIQELNEEIVEGRKNWNQWHNSMRAALYNGFAESLTNALFASENFFEALGEGLKNLGKQILSQITQMLILSTLFKAFGLQPGSIPGVQVVESWSKGSIKGSIKDGIVQNGRIITTDPDDYLIATKTPGSLGGGKGSVVVNINNNTSAEVSANSFFDGTREIIDIVIDGINRDVNGFRGVLRSI